MFLYLPFANLQLVSTAYKRQTLYSRFHIIQTPPQESGDLRITICLTPLPETFSLKSYFPINTQAAYPSPFKPALESGTDAVFLISELFAYIYPLASFFPHLQGTSFPFYFNSLCFLHSFSTTTACFLKTSLPVKPEFLRMYHFANLVCF